MGHVGASAFHFPHLEGTPNSGSEVNGAEAPVFSVSTTSLSQMPHHHYRSAGLLCSIGQWRHDRSDFIGLVHVHFPTHVRHNWVDEHDSRGHLGHCVSQFPNSLSIEDEKAVRDGNIGEIATETFNS